jgi:hypothetical protein
MRPSISSLCFLLAVSATVIANPFKRDAENTDDLVIKLESSPTVGSAHNISITATIENTVSPNSFYFYISGRMNLVV